MCFKSRAKDQENGFQRREAEIQKKDAVIQKGQAENNKIESKNNWLTQLLAQLRSMLFGSKSERFEEDTNQMKIEFEEYATEEGKQDETPVKLTITYQREKKSKKENGRNRLPENLQVVEYIIEPDENPTEMKRIGEEHTEILDFKPSKFLKLVLVR